MYWQLQQKMQTFSSRYITITTVAQQKEQQQKIDTKRERDWTCVIKQKIKTKNPTSGNHQALLYDKKMSRQLKNHAKAKSKKQQKKKMLGERERKMYKINNVYNTTMTDRRRCKKNHVPTMYLVYIISLPLTNNVHLPCTKIWHAITVRDGLSKNVRCTKIEK